MWVCRFKILKWGWGWKVRQTARNCSGSGILPIKIMEEMEDGMSLGYAKRLGNDRGR